MESLINFIQTQSLEDIQKISNTVSALRQEKLVSPAFLDENEAELAFSRDFLDGSYNFTFLIQGDPQVGKTTFLNCLLNDDIYPSLKSNSINIVQYDQNCHEPHLYTAELKDIFNMNKNVFTIRPEHLKDTGMKGRDQIHTFLKKSVPRRDSIEDYPTEKSEMNQSVYVIKHRIKWLEEAIQEKFILDRIQFVDYNISIETNLQYNSIRILQKIEASKHHYELYIADGQKLFTENVARKYRESQKERSIVIINRTDTLGTNEHFRKINKRLPILSQILNKSAQEIKETIEDSEETNEMRHEIFYQSFLEEQKIQQEHETKPLYFLSGLYAINKTLIEEFEKSDNDAEKAVLSDLFAKRNRTSKVFAAIKKKSEEQKIPIIQGFLNKKGQVDEFKNDNSLSGIKSIITKIANQELFDSASNVFNGIKEQKARLLSCESYSTNKLTETEINELSSLFNKELSMLFLQRLKDVKDQTAVLLKDCIAHLYDFAQQVKEINPDFYFAKLNYKTQLSEKLTAFKAQWAFTVKLYLKTTEKNESDKKKKFDEIMAENEAKKHLHKYIQDNIQPVNKELQEESSDFIDTISKFAHHVENSIDFFVGNVNAQGGLATQVTQYFAHFFNKNSKIQVFDERIANSISMLNEITHIIMQGYELYYKELMKKAQDNFEDYKTNAPGFSVERTREIIQQYL